MTYSLRRGNQQLAGVSAQAIGEELERIRTTNDGRLKPDDVVAAAKSTKSPLHPAFTWNDSDAAQQFRLWEARFLIRSVFVIRDDSDQPEQAFVHVTIGGDAISGEEDSKRDRYYQSTSVITGDELRSALDELNGKLAAAQSSVDDVLRTARRLNISARKHRQIATVARAVKTARAAASKI